MQTEIEDTTVLANLDTVSDGMRECLIVCDARGYVVRINRAASKLTLRAKRDSIDRDIVEVLPLIGNHTISLEDDHPAIRAIRENRVVEFSHFTRFIQNDGKQIPLSGYASPLIDCDSRICGVMVVFQHKTAELHAAENLSFNANILQFIENAPVAIAMFDRDMRYIATSQRWISDFHLENRQLIGECHYSIFPDLPDRWIDIHKKALNGKIFKAEEDFFVREDGTETWLRWEVQPWYQSNNEVGGLIFFSEDITRRKKAENDALTSLERLQHAQKMESIGRLAGGIAHDYNNILHIITGYAQLAQQNLNTSDPNYQYLGEILHAVDISTNLTRQLLSFARQQPISPSRLDINEAIRHALPLLRLLVKKDIQIDTSLAGDIAAIWIDHTQLSQILLNLVINANDAIRAQGNIIIITQRISMAKHDVHSNALNSNVYTSLVIKDNGVGMDEDTKKRCFEPFYTTKEVGKGTGLGLATVFGIVKQNGGELRVESEIGQGTTFQMLFPAATDTSLKPIEEELQNQT